MSEQPALPLKPPKSTADHVLALLRAHYLPEYRQPEGIFAPEIGAPDGMRRADLIWLQTAGRRRQLIGHEIKVTRADLRHELEQPNKATSWKQFCDRWWLVIPTLTLLDGLDIPDDWGIMLPPSGRRTRSMTVHREAPTLKPTTQDPALRTLATWLFWRHHEADHQARHHASLSDSLYRRIDVLTQEIEELNAERLKLIRLDFSPSAPPLSGAPEVIYAEQPEEPA